MDLAAWANRNLLDLWHELSGAGELPRHNMPPVYRWPLLYTRFQEQGLLFVGLNPSWNARWLEKAWRRKWHTGSSPRSGCHDALELFEWAGSSPTPGRIRDILELDGAARREDGELYPYFMPMQKMAHEVGLGDSWSHVDLFAVRERAQEQVKRILDIDPSGVVESHNARRQLEISLKLISGIDPICVVVANALAAKILKVRWKISDKALENSVFREKGHHELEQNKKGVPVFFSGMLSGQRALDKGSLERLTWQVSRAINEAEALQG